MVNKKKVKKDILLEKKNYKKNHKSKNFIENNFIKTNFQKKLIIIELSTITHFFVINFIWDPLKVGKRQKSHMFVLIISCNVVLATSKLHSRVCIVDNLGTASNK